MFNRSKKFLPSCFLVLTLITTALAQQSADPHFDARVDKPAFAKNFPRVLFDEAHYNFDTTNNRYKPFGDLLFNDGYHIAVNRQPFTKASLASHKILVIVNPLGSEDTDDEGAAGPAFTAAECEVVSDWVRGGGALSDALESEPGVFSKLYVNMVRAGEVGGSLESTLSRLRKRVDDRMS